MYKLPEELTKISWKQLTDMSQVVSITKDTIKSNCCHKLFWRAYENILITAYGYVINCFHKLSQALSESSYVSRETQIIQSKQKESNFNVSWKRRLIKLQRDRRWTISYQRRKTVFSSSTRHREATMSAGIRNC